MGAAQGRVPELIRSTILESRIYGKGIKTCVPADASLNTEEHPCLTFSSALNRTWLSGKAPSRWNHWSVSSCGSASRFLTGSTSDPIGWSQPLDNCGASKREKIQKLMSRSLKCINVDLIIRPSLSASDVWGHGPESRKTCSTEDWCCGHTASKTKLRDVTECLLQY